MIEVFCLLVYICSWLFLSVVYDVCHIKYSCNWAWVFLFTPLVNTVFAIIVAIYGLSSSFRAFTRQIIP